MRQNGTLYYLLSYHPSTSSGQALGSIGLTTESNGIKLAGLRYNARG
jgi:hypothetical protein